MPESIGRTACAHTMGAQRLMRGSKHVWVIRQTQDNYTNRD